jgi:hypothetical protein
MDKKIKLLIGRREKVSFPDLQLLDIDAKVDTGAYTTALHCHEIEVRQESQKSILYFKLLDPSHPEYNEQLFRFENFTEKHIKNSFSEPEKRFIIKTRIKLGPKIVLTSISLTDRGQMRYPVLIGRKILRKRFIVDVNETYLLKTKQTFPE